MNNKELREAAEEYFDAKKSKGEVPTVSGLCLTLGLSRAKLTELQRSGKSPSLIEYIGLRFGEYFEAEIIQKGKSQAALSQICEFYDFIGDRKASPSLSLSDKLRIIGELCGGEKE